MIAQDSVSATNNDLAAHEQTDRHQTKTKNCAEQKKNAELSAPIITTDLPVSRPMIDYHDLNQFRLKEF